MKSNLKLALSLLLLLSFTISTLISCQSSDTNTNPNPTQTPPVEEESSPPEFTPVEGIDYGGYKFRILGYDGMVTDSWYFLSICEVVVEEENGDPINDAFYRRNKEVEALYNVEITLVPTQRNGNDLTMYTKSILAGSDEFDVAFISGTSAAKALNRANMAHNLFDIPSLDLSKSWWDQNAIPALSIGGKLAFVMGDVNFFSAVAPMGIFANKQLMQLYAIDNLYQMVRDGKWTWDVLHTIAKQTTKDLNGDGIIDKNDQIGLFAQSGHLFSAINCAGVLLTPKNKNDIPEFSPDFGKLTAVADKVIPILNDNSCSIMAENILAGYSNIFFELIMPKFRDGEVMFHMNQMLFNFELRNMDADFAILPFPKIDENQEKYGSIILHGQSTYTIIPSTCEDTVKTANILQAMGYYSQKYVMPAYYDVTVTNKLLRDDDSAEMLDIILKNRVFDLASLYRWGDIVTVLMNLTASGKPETLISQLEKIEGKANSEIRKTLDELEVIY